MSPLIIPLGRAIGELSLKEGNDLTLRESRGADDGLPSPSVHGSDRYSCGLIVTAADGEASDVAPGDPCVNRNHGTMTWSPTKTQALPVIRSEEPQNFLW